MITGVHYECAACHKQFSSSSYRNQHQRQCSGVQYHCGECKQQFNSLSALQKHRVSDHQRCPVAANKRQRPEDSTASTSGQNVKRRRSQLHQVDPIQPEPHMLPTGDDELSAAVKQVYEQHWSSIRTQHRIGHRVQDMYNFRLEDLNMNSLRDQLQKLFHQQQAWFRINASFGLICYPQVMMNYLQQ